MDDAGEIPINTRGCSARLPAGEHQRGDGDDQQNRRSEQRERGNEHEAGRRVVSQTPPIILAATTVIAVFHCPPGCIAPTL
jgi:hypothetical protein